ncbi:MAG: hypothetical protein AVDCRST_MAG68-1445, partial [uncultured Gemmatimonadetes bacterium]
EAHGARGLPAGGLRRKGRRLRGARDGLHRRPHARDGVVVRRSARRHAPGERRAAQGDDRLQRRARGREAGGLAPARRGAARHLRRHPHAAALSGSRRGAAGGARPWGNADHRRGPGRHRLRPVRGGHGDRRRDAVAEAGRARGPHPQPRRHAGRPLPGRAPRVPGRRAAAVV